jgi:uncharacterized protein
MTGYGDILKGTLCTEAFIIPYEGIYLAYFPLRRAAFPGNASTVNFLYSLKSQSGADASLEEQALLEFLNDLGVLGDAGDFPPAVPEDEPFEPTRVTLFLTTRCNLRCLYCYASAGTDPGRDMDIDLARRAIELVARNAVAQGKHSIEVAFHGGGEPTINWTILTGAVAYAKELADELNLEPRFKAASNGVFSAEQCRWIVSNLSGMSLSVDGLAEIHDYHRPLAGDGGSSEIVLRTLEAFEKAGFPFSIRTTVTATSCEEVPKGVEFLLNVCRPKQIMLEPVYELGRARGKNLNVMPEKFVASFREARKIADQYDTPLIYSAARLEVLTGRFCGACSGSFCITPTGKVSACYETFEEGAECSDHFLFGRYDPASCSFIFDGEKLEQIKKRNVQSIPWCQGCFCKWHCAGDCPNLVRHASVDGEFTGHSRCEITRALILDQILSKIRESGGAFWKGDESLVGTTICRNFH